MLLKTPNYNLVMRLNTQQKSTLEGEGRWLCNQPMGKGKGEERQGTEKHDWACKTESLGKDDISKWCSMSWEEEEPVRGWGCGRLCWIWDLRISEYQWPFGSSCPAGSWIRWRSRYIPRDCAKWWALFNLWSKRSAGCPLRMKPWEASS